MSSEKCLALVIMINAICIFINANSLPIMNSFIFHDVDDRNINVIPETDQKTNIKRQTANESQLNTFVGAETNVLEQIDNEISKLAKATNNIGVVANVVNSVISSLVGLGALGVLGRFLYNKITKGKANLTHRSSKIDLNAKKPLNNETIPNELMLNLLPHANSWETLPIADGLPTPIVVEPKIHPITKEVESKIVEETVEAELKINTD